jgi:hypothetical protein
MMEQRDIREHITHEPRRHHDYSVRVPDNQIPWGDGLTTDRDGSAEFSCTRLRSRTGPDALEARMLCGPSIKCVRATKGDGAAFPGGPIASRSNSLIDQSEAATRLERQ